MRRRRSIVGLVLVLAAACSSAPVDDATAPTVQATTSTSTSSSTTTTVPVAADLADLVATTTMTDRGRRLFLAASPAIEEPTTFGHNCGVDNQSDQSGARTHTQGCYVAGRIHLLAPDRPEARELLYVVAAHELLHVAYANLGPADRARIDAEVEAARAGNDRLEERLKPYGSGPTLDNEIHSILGSEFDGLSAALEAHYAQFFANRAAVVAARQRTLGSREDEIRRLKAQVDDLDARINALKDTQEQLRARGNSAGYNANVPLINGLITQYNARVDALNAQIDEYNSLLGR